MKSNIAIVIGAIIMSICILASGGIYEGIPVKGPVLVRLNKFTGEIAYCTVEQGCVSQKGWKPAKE